MFRRQSAASADEPAQDKMDVTGSAAAQNGDSTDDREPQGRGAASAGKGRPTPKRSEAAPRRQPFAAPGNRKEASAQARTRARTERARRAEGLRRGDERYLPAKDQGPVRAIARDYVDSRRMLSEYYLYVVGVLFVLLILPFGAARVIVYPLVLIAMVTVILEGYITGRRVRKIAAQRFPGERTKGVALYAVMRSAQIRKLRLPPPRVKRGDKI
ncbi:MAG TPA: DUF3043 domain-containing protein [Streptosporangiaceae bacterium]|nr:DUF3043 domain-containing protein [Streptosporangiaceae bacterium]